MNLEFIKTHQLILFECISGSRAYGLARAGSDTDIRGVFVMPKRQFYGLEYIQQINNTSNDIVFYELKRFIDLLSKNNPNILELLNIPQDCIIYTNPLFEEIKKVDFLSKSCKDTFAGYAMTQIKKARGLNKKVLNPVSEERKTVLDFCYVIQGGGSLPLKIWLEKNNYSQEKCGLVKISNMREIYALYYDISGKSAFKGIIRKETANEVSLSSVPKGQNPVAYLAYNKDGYSAYCKDYKQYWDWVEKRNEDRYKNTLAQGKGYDAKNLMHTFRLLDMAEEIATSKKIIVRRPNPDFLFKIRDGHFSYEELIEKAAEKTEKINDLFAKSDLPESPDLQLIEELLIQIREKFYQSN